MSSAAGRYLAGAGARVLRALAKAVGPMLPIAMLALPACGTDGAGALGDAGAGTGGAASPAGGGGGLGGAAGGGPAGAGEAAGVGAEDAGGGRAGSGGTGGSDGTAGFGVDDGGPAGRDGSLGDGTLRDGTLGDGAPACPLEGGVGQGVWPLEAQRCTTDEDCEIGLDSTCCARRYVGLAKAQPQYRACLAHATGCTTGCAGRDLADDGLVPNSGERVTVVVSCVAYDGGPKRCRTRAVSEAGP